MRQIALCICTYNRPEGLRALLAALDKQRLETITDEEVQIVVIDNSRDASAAAVCSTYAQQGRFKAKHIHEPRKGLATARNAALTSAVDLGASYLVFVDDDELPEPLWLEPLVQTIERLNCAAAVGPVLPIFESQPSAWLPTQAYATDRQSDGPFLDDGYTGNTIIRISAVKAHGLRFDGRFSSMGGEDTIFFRRLLDLGEKIARAERAIVHEVVPAYRMSPYWLWRRWYRTGFIEAHLGAHDPASIAGRASNFARGVLRLSAGAVRILGATLFWGWRKPQAVTASFYTACRGAGLIASAFGLGYSEYTHRSYR